MDRTILEQAFRARDPRFDGHFFVGVRTTGVYCRPVCPVKPPRAENVTYFLTAAAAEDAGFRPCLRCRPESSPGTPAWLGSSATVQRGLRLIEEGALDHGGTVARLGERLGVTSRHLSRLFRQHLGAPPKAVAQTRRLQFAKKLLNETRLPVTEIALASGYGSVRRFNDHFRRVYGRPPGQLRRQPAAETREPLVLRLGFRPPYDFDALLTFLRRRAIPGVEQVSHGSYRRTITVDGSAGSLTVTADEGHDRLCCRIELARSLPLLRVVNQLRRLFDLDADPREVADGLARDPGLRPLVTFRPGLRLPGAWDPFEIAVRAIVGQQVSVAAATGVMGKIAQRFGTMSDGVLLFPEPESLVNAADSELPMPRRRAAALRALARAVAGGEIGFDDGDPDTLRRTLVELPGIGPWTAQYVAMRAASDPDAFLPGDLVLRRMAAKRLGVSSDRELLARAESWRPWRAYAAMHLWAAAAD